MSHENAPATTLLATNCSCCGRALVDAVSVETGIGPECRKKFGGDVVDEAARDEANRLVHEVARKGVSKSKAREICNALFALGFEVLSERIAKRFRLRALPPAPTASEPNVEALRATYAAILTDFTYDNISRREFTALVRATGASTPAEYVAAAEAMTCTCRRCAGTGDFITGSVNGKPTGPGGACFRCEGRGFQTLADARRNRVFDSHHFARAAS